MTTRTFECAACRMSPAPSLPSKSDHATSIVDGLNVALSMAMSFAAVVDRVRADFMEMPGLELTVPQAVRLWTVGVDDCRFVIDALVDAGFLKWTTRRTIIRTGAEFRAWLEPVPVDIPVRSTVRRNKSV